MLIAALLAAFSAGGAHASAGGGAGCPLRIAFIGGMPVPVFAKFLPKRLPFSIIYLIASILWTFMFLRGKREEGRPPFHPCSMVPNGR
ncbi:hypothetical protein NST62_00780 [Ureibacillus sp. FSL K6-8385]|uniref:hypothetical protein n=1 Tax=Ureibacillus TaxID=160795 RepID=UPI002E23EBEA|nr:hypothetical protein [Ureibacillus terrenus]